MLGLCREVVSLYAAHFESLLPCDMKSDEKNERWLAYTSPGSFSKV